MKIRVDYTIEVDDDMRKAVAHNYGIPGKAPREVIRRFLESEGTGGLESLTADSMLGRADV